MSERNRGIYAFISNPIAYFYLQKIVFGKHNFDREVVNEYIRPFNGMNILDIGCGPADMLSFLNENKKIDYIGFDANEKNIEAAKTKFGNQGQFYHGYVTEQSCMDLPKFDLVMAIGVMHHLDDTEVKSLSRLHIRFLGREVVLLLQIRHVMTGNVGQLDFLSAEIGGEMSAVQMRINLYYLTN